MVSFEALFQCSRIQVRELMPSCLVEFENGQTMQCDEQPAKVGSVLHLCNALDLWRMNLLLRVHDCCL